MTATLLDRFVRWNLDLDGDLYGDDERERLRWYEGIATAAQVQGIAVPWAIAIVMWFAGGSAVLPLLIVLAAWVLPMFLATLYVQGRRVDTTPRTWSGKRILFGVLGGLPIVVAAMGAIYQRNPDGYVWEGSVIGAVIGGAIGIAVMAQKSKRRRRAEVSVAADVD